VLAPSRGRGIPPFAALPDRLLDAGSLEREGLLAAAPVHLLLMRRSARRDCPSSRQVNALQRDALFWVFGRDRRQTLDNN